jgi:hypothetical protein
MRGEKTYFEQVPIDEAEAVLRREAALAEELGKTPAPFTEEFLMQQESNPSKAQP